ncbi:MAG TPA: hypothetical protein VL947_01600 [Cytophagales bacterium]|nr:hypothetical protein [Cytophagales bacterium]
MKKNIFKLSALALAGALGLFSCGTKEEVKPTAGKPSVDVKFEGANYGVQKDFAVSAQVSTTGDTAYINISVNGTQPTGAIYINYQKDNEKAVKFTKQPSGASIPGGGYFGYANNGTGRTAFNYNGSDYTFDIPNSVNTAWKLTIPILLRNTATAQSDVFTIWVTQNGENGRFDNPAKGLAYGVATVTLNYTNQKLISFYETTLGNSADTIGSLFSTSTGSNYKRSDANNANVGPTIDFIYNTPLTNYVFGSAATNASGDIESNQGATSVTAGFDVDGPDNTLGNADDGFHYIKNYTRFAKSTANFDNIAGDTDLAGAVDAAVTSSTTASKVVYTSAPTGEVFAFVTKAGKKGLVKVVSAGLGGAVAGQTTIQVKVQR